MLPVSGLPGRLLELGVVGGARLVRAHGREMSARTIRLSWMRVVALPGHRRTDQPYTINCEEPHICTDGVGGEAVTARVLCWEAERGEGHDPESTAGADLPRPSVGFAHACRGSCNRLFTVRGECSAVMHVHAASLAALRNRMRVL